MRSVPREQSDRRPAGADKVDERISASKFVWLFVFGCFAGFVLETVFTLFNKGYLESRRGMIYGPFNQVYGFGLILMVLFLKPVAHKGNGFLFGVSAVVGGTFEFLCSWVQEKVLGTVSWNYSADPLSIGGRTSLLFMFYWGVIGVVLMRWLYPRVSGVIDKIPARPGNALCRVVACFMAVNMIISLVAVNRWTERTHGISASSRVEMYLDAIYPDERLQRIYPSMMKAISE